MNALPLQSCWHSLYACISGEPNICFEHAELDLTSIYDENIENIRLGENQTSEHVSALPCEGLCYVEEIIQLAENGNDVKL